MFHHPPFLALNRAGGESHFHFGNRFGHFDIAGTGVRAVEHGIATRQTCRRQRPCVQLVIVIGGVGLGNYRHD